MSDLLPQSVCTFVTLNTGRGGRSAGHLLLHRALQQEPFHRRENLPGVPALPSLIIKSERSNHAGLPTRTRVAAFVPTRLIKQTFS